MRKISHTSKKPFSLLSVFIITFLLSGFVSFSQTLVLKTSSDTGTSDNDLFTDLSVTNNVPNTVTPPTPSLQNNALSFLEHIVRDRDDKITIPYNSVFDFSGGFTIEAWIYPASFDTSIFSVGTSFTSDTFTLDLYTGGYLSLYINNSILRNKIIMPIPLNTWTHVAATYDNSMQKLYVNGILIAFKSFSTVISNDQDDIISIGYGDDGDDEYYYQGSMDEVRIWSKALTAAEILSQKDCKIPVDSAGLIAYYDFNQGTANEDNTAITTLRDATANNLHGTLSGFAKTGTSSNFVEGQEFSYSISASTNMLAGMVGTPIEDITISTDLSCMLLDFKSYTISPALPNGLSINAETGTISGTPTEESSQTQYTITRGAGSDTTTVSITVDSAPLLSISGIPAISVAEDSPYSFTVSGADSDGTALSFSIVNKPSWATFTPSTSDNTAILTGTPTNADVGTTTGIVISVTSGGETVLLPAFDIEVTNTDDAPTISGTPETIIAEDSPYSFTVNGEDVDGTALSFSIENKPSWATFTPMTNTATLTGTPTNEDVGTTIGIVISVTSGGETVLLPAFDIEVTNTSDTPTISGIPAISVAEDSPYSFTVSGADVDGTALSFSIEHKPSWATFTPMTNTATLTGTPTNADVGIETDIIISVTSGGETVSLSAFDIEVTNTDDAPTISGTPETIIAEDSPYSFTVSGADVDGTALSFSIEHKPSWATFTPMTNTATLTGTPTNEDVGTTIGIIISVTSGGETASLSAFDIEVTNTDDAPTISGTPETIIAEDSPYSFTVSGADSDGTALSFSIENKPSWATFTPSTSDNTATLTGTPTNEDVGTTTGIVISVTSGGEKVSLSPFNIEVTNTLNNEDYSDVADISVWPNPTSGILNITVTEKADYRLLDIRGQFLREGTISAGEKIEINISSFAKGIYLLNIKTNNSSLTRKVVRK